MEIGSAQRNAGITPSTNLTRFESCIRPMDDMLERMESLILRIAAVNTRFGGEVSPPAQESQPTTAAESFESTLHQMVSRCGSVLQQLQNEVERLEEF